MRNKELKRMLELAGIKPNMNENVNSLSSLELTKIGSDGKTYGIVRENKKYFIKVTDKVGIVSESDFDYIGGLQNKPKHSYTSYEDATKNLNFLFDELNEIYGGSKHINILESDTITEKKFVLKQKSKKKEEPKMDFDFGGGSDEEEMDFDFGNEKGGDGSDEEEMDFDFGGDSGDEDTGEDEDLDLDSDDEDPIKSIQKTTGKLGQKLRDTEDISSDLQKWVAKSVLSALNLDELDSSDKKDIIKTIKKSESNDEEGSEEDFDFSGMEEEYDSYMEEDPNLLTRADLEGDIEEGNAFTGKLAKTPKGGKFELGGKTYRDTSDYDSHMKDECFYCRGEGCPECSNELDMRDIDMPIKDKGYLNLDSEYLNDDMYGPNYDRHSSYIKDTNEYDEENFLDRDFDMESWRSRMEKEGFFDEPVDEDLETSRGGERYDRDELLFDRYGGPIGENRLRRKRRIKEHHYNDRMDTIEQENAYEKVEKMAMSQGLEIGWCHKEGGLDPEESKVYLDVLDNGRKKAKIRINSMGGIEMGHMRGNRFIGEPIDSLSDFNEVFIEDETLIEDDMTDPRMNPSPAPSRPKEKPSTKPKEPDTDKPSRPSKRPFTPPPHITPGEETRPKADYDDDYGVEFE